MCSHEKNMGRYLVGRSDDISVSCKPQEVYEEYSSPVLREDNQQNSPSRQMPVRQANPRKTMSEYEYAVWWSCVVEPGDYFASHLRSVCGEEEAQRWACAPRITSLPDSLYAVAAPEHWEKTWHRWKARIDMVNIEKELSIVHRIGGYVLTPDSAQWPHMLKDLGPVMPSALWVKGRISSQPCVALVGARASTRAGERTCRDMAVALTDKGFTVVSGGAIGIDAAAHHGAVDAGGKTYALMAGGLGALYPATNRELFEKIVSTGGALISEVPPSWRPARWRFLARNRLIAALSMGVVVIEASYRSGALATARHGVELGREVGAVPGSVDGVMSQGCHELIRQGGILIRHAEDIQRMIYPFADVNESVGYDHPHQKTRVVSGIETLPEEQRRVWEAMPLHSAVTVEKLSYSSGLSRSEVLSALAYLDLAGWVSAHSRGWRRIQKNK
ncbi:DNA-processing protein DprA [Schaalia sp. lx-100]|uniref:DNA-processing protein DprA n=1 Tax=Schaalia sp. lx-100 TaxID=2899081 RepID=UPI001E538552|nr:DNA-processing protein DprA [Schaalia sp. lx-100]MCD4557124.1 DNA-processing protein DprA [Schaalia sp. lx-100]